MCHMQLENSQIHGNFTEKSNKTAETKDTQANENSAYNIKVNIWQTVDTCISSYVCQIKEVKLSLQFCKECTQSRCRGS